jgi:hypothetical protein
LPTPTYLIDVRCGIIMDVEASRAVRQAEVGAARTMLERTEERFGLKPQRLAADSAYGSAPMLNWLVEDKQIAPHIPVIDKSKREDGTFSREQFHYDTATDTYVCPTGKTMTTSGILVNDGTTLLYRGSTRDCASCSLKARCCPNGPVRKVPRSIYERARDVARSLVGTEAFERSRHERKRIEMRFAHLKRILRLGRLRLRGPRGRPRRVRTGGDRPEPETSGQAGDGPAAAGRSACCASLDKNEGGPRAYRN